MLVIQHCSSLRHCCTNPHRRADHRQSALRCSQVPFICFTHFSSPCRSTRKPLEQTLEADVPPDPCPHLLCNCRAVRDIAALDPVGQDKQPHIWLFALYKGVHRFSKTCATYMPKGQIGQAQTVG